MRDTRSLQMLDGEFGIDHTTLQVDHVGDHAAEGRRLRFLPQAKRRGDVR